MIFLVAGARPNFMNVAPIINELKNENVKYKLIHTGQHYDFNMSKVFFNDLGITEPDIHLNVGSAFHSALLLRSFRNFNNEKILESKFLGLSI